VREAEAEVLLLLFFHELSAVGLPQSLLMVKRVWSSASLGCAESELVARKKSMRSSARRRRFGLAIVNKNNWRSLEQCFVWT